METTVSFGYWIRRQRKALDLTQQMLAERVGCSLAAIKKIESDQRRPSRQIAGRLADVLGVPVARRSVFLECARGIRPVDELLLAGELAASPASQHRPVGPTEPFRNNLPLQLTSFIGRERELQDLKQLLPTTRLLTLTGPGGTGKTRLAVELAKEVLQTFANGACLVEFASLADPALVAQTVATAVGVRDQPGRTILDGLMDYLRGKTMLVLFDNCEHLIDACAQLADALLRRAPGLTILASSRESLSIAGETAYRVPSLPLPSSRKLTDLDSIAQNDCVHLFVDRALAAYPHFRLSDQNVQAIVQICRRLDGIPLAIELAAARTRVFPPDQIAARLDERFKLLTGGSRSALERHQTLFALIEWSHNLLSGPERALLRRLSVFAGGWSMEAMQAVCGDGLGAESLETLTHLADKSLVVVEEPGVAAEGRYRLLDTIRQYARDRLLESGESESIRDRHLEFFLHFAEYAEPKLRSQAQLEWLNRLEVEHDNLRTALAWSLESGKSEHALQLAGALYYFWGLGAHISEGQRWMGEALALSEREQAGSIKPARGLAAVDAARRAKALYGFAWFQLVAFDLKSAHTAAEESLRLWREVGDPWWTALTLEALGLILGTEGQVEAAIAGLEEGVSLGRQLEDPLPLAVCLVRLGDTVKVKGTDMDAARQFLEEGVAMARIVGDRSVLSEGLRELGSVYYSEGKLSAAESVITEALSEARSLGSIVQVVLALGELVAVSCLKGDRARARNYCTELWALARDTGALMASWFVLLASGLAECFGGDPGKGVQLLAACDALIRQRGVDMLSGDSPIFRVVRQAIGRAQAQLNPAAFKGEWATGQQMTMDQALGSAVDGEGQDLPTTTDSAGPAPEIRP